MDFQVTLDTISFKKALKLWYKKRILISMIVNSLVILYGLAIIVVSQFNKDYPVYFGIIMVWFGSIVLITSVIRVHRDINLSIKQMQQRVDGDSCDYQFFLLDDSIVNINLKNGNSVSIKYRDFKICIENDEIILLHTNLKQFIYIPKSTLNDVECEKIIRAIQDRGIPHKRVG